MPVPKLLVTAVLAGAYVALGATRKIEGPRLDSTHVSTAEYGTPLDDFYGIRKLTGRPIIWADDLREEKKKTKGKSGKYAEYKYYGDWAVAIAGHQIDSVRRIWFDEHLVYQIGDVGPISVGGFASNLLTSASGRVLKLGQGRNMRIYLGDDTQNPDPLIEAWFEDHPDFGVNCTSAMRGTAYIVFQDIPLEKFGNRIPQVTVEAISAKIPSYPYEERTTNYSLSNAQFSPDYSTIYAVAGGNFEAWDVATRTQLAEIATSVGGYAAAAGGFFGLTSFFGQELVFVGQMGGESTITDSASIPVIMNEVWHANGATFMLPAAGTDAYTTAGTAVGIPFAVSSVFSDLSGLPIFLGNTGTTVHIFDYDTGTQFDVTSTGTGNPFGFANANGEYVIVQDTGDALLVDPVTQTVLTTATVTTPNDVMMRAIPVGSSTFWLGFNEYSSADLSLVRTIDQNDWLGWGTIQASLYDPINHAIIIKPLFSAKWVWLYLDRVGSSGVTLGDIAEAEGSQVNCTIDGSLLDQTIPGYSVGPGSAKDRIAPLFDLHDSILRLHDFGIQGIKRGTSSAGTILTPKFVSDDHSGKGDGPKTRYEVDTAQDSDLPQRIEVKYAALNNDQEINNVIALRHTSAVDTSRVNQIDLSTYADTPDAMQQKADRFLRRIWNSRATVKNTLTAQYLAAEPGDIYDLDLDGVVWTCELEKVTLSATNPSFKCEWRRTFPSLNSLGQGTAPDMDGRTDDSIFIPSQTTGFMLDTPYTEDADNDINPSLYYAAGKITSSWGGAAVWDGSDGSYDDNVAAVDSSQGATWGFASTQLADANPNLWDRGNTISVTVYGGTLSSSTEADIDADPTINQFAIGRNGHWEICNFTTATLTGSTSISRTYDLSGFLRGRRGTEMHTGGHTAGDKFLMLSTAQTLALGADAIGDDLSYKIQSLGRDPDTAPAIDFTPFTGATLKPYAPDRIKWTTDGTDMFGEIIRRSRTFSGWLDSGVVALGENSEEYEVDILDGSGNVLRTITVSGTNLFTYANADILADGNTVGVPPSYNAYQMSDTVGRGFALAA